MEFDKIEKLYHFTKFETALLILEGNRLRFAPYKTMNDIQESYRPVFYGMGLPSGIEVKIESELSKYRQISMVQDVNDIKGYTISPMWGHYADKGQGVCLVFDKDKFTSLKFREDYSDQIQYVNDYDCSVLCNTSDVRSWVKTCHKDIFFNKSNSWSYEQEYRVIRRFDGEATGAYFDINDSLIAIIMCYAPDVVRSETVFNSTQYNILKKIIGDRQIQFYEIGEWDGQMVLRDFQGDLPFVKFPFIYDDDQR